MSSPLPPLSRGGPIEADTIGIASIALTPTGTDASAAVPGPKPVDTGHVEGDEIVMPAINTEPEGADAGLPKPKAQGERVGYAIVGLGRLSLEEILPAFGKSQFSRPVALVSGSPEKARIVAKQYGIREEAIYGYDDMARMADNPEIEIVYIVTPNALHLPQTVAAARAGKHVLCEKPLAMSSEEAREMIAACREAGVRLMTAYRCQYEPNHLEIARLIRSGVYGPLRHISAVNTQNVTDPEQWRLRQALSGGGSLPNIGIYCLNGARMVTGEEPVEISAQISSPKGDPRFREVEETVSFTARFPSGVIANCLTSHGTMEERSLKLGMPDAAITLENAFAYRGQKLVLSLFGDRAREDRILAITPKDQFAAEMDHFSRCVRDGVEARTPGEEGLQDMILMEAIYESARTGRPVALDAPRGRDAFRGPELRKAG